MIDYIHIKTVEGLDTTRVRSILFNQMDTSAMMIAQQSNIFLFNVDAARKNLFEEFALDQVTIEKEYPNTLRVDIAQRPFRIYWYDGKKMFDVDSKGILVKEVDPALLSSLPEGYIASTTPTHTGGAAPKPTAPKEGGPTFIKERNTAERKVGDSVLSRTIALSLAKIQDALQEKNIETRYILMDPAEVDASVITAEGWALHMNLFSDLSTQAKNASILLSQKIKDDRKKLDYVDVRFDNRLYYKTR